MNFEVGFAILIGFIGGFVSAVILTVSLLKKLARMSTEMGGK